MSDNPLCRLETLGQSLWLDFLSRDLIQSGQLQQYIDEDGLGGLTSNPSIFQKALADGDQYDDEIARWAEQGKDEEGMYTALTVGDIQAAADIFRPTFERLQHRDGFVSLEVNPHLAYRAEETIEEARWLWSLVDRPNLFIKVPATVPGLRAIRQLISDGINVNVTLLFGLPRYLEVAEAYLEGLEERVLQGNPIADVHSVASFFLSRIDVMVDPKLQQVAEDASHGHAAVAKRFLGQTAIASAREAYRLAGHVFAQERFSRLKEQGATIQRLLWASTSTKNPDYPDVKYVEALIAPDTVNTVPLETLNAYRDHGNPAVRINDDPEFTQDLLQRLPEVGVDLAQVTKQLEEEGVQKFIESYDKLMESLARKRDEVLVPSSTP